mmetsp:Transcript_88/g.147  ORF Transcript_88/g.147 Transcript_88/m.147 type:complete len:233 (-) Transcript_88:250-948(-)
MAGIQHSLAPDTAKSVTGVKTQASTVEMSSSGEVTTGRFVDDPTIQEKCRASLPSSLKQNLPALYRKKLVPVDLSFDTVREDKDAEMTVHRAHKTVVRQQRAKASVCFVVKRPGCVLCKEQGRALTEMLSGFSEKDVGAWAVIKEVGVDDEGLLSLYQNFFNFPFFKDSSMNIYKAMGNRKVGIVPNPLKIAARYLAIRKRLKEKNIEGNIIGDGEGMVLGGVLIFDVSAAT